jgi:ribosomal protein S14
MGNALLNKGYKILHRIMCMKCKQNHAVFKSLNQLYLCEDCFDLLAYDKLIFENKKDGYYRDNL